MKCPACAGTRQAFPVEDGVTIHADNGCSLCDLDGRSWGGVLEGDVLARLAELRPESVSCVVTSPPFLSLRRYPTEDVVWGGDPACDHGELSAGNKNPLRSGGDGATGSTLEGGKRTQTAQREAVQGVEGGYTGSRRWQHSGVSRQETPDAWVHERPIEESIPPANRRCKDCQKFGLSDWIDKERGVVRVTCPQCKTETLFEGVESSGSHVLEGATPRWIDEVRDDRPQEYGNVSQGATCSRCGAWRGQFGLEPTRELYIEHSMMVLRALRRVLRKDGVIWWNLDDARGHRTLCHDLIPERFLLAAEADGWLVCSKTIWAKPNAMPESAKRRPTDAHENVFMLAKHPSYWYDQEAVREPQSQNTHSRGYGDGGPKERIRASEGNHEGWTESTRQQWLPNGRNLRSVWTMNTAQTPEAHFATFPPELPRRCIEAACPREVCAKCGTARVRLVESEPGQRTPDRDWKVRTYGNKWDATPSTIGWSDCSCSEPDYQPGIVLDPFAGVGTTLYVARQLNRRFIGIELSPTYAQMARDKLSKWWAPGNLAPRPAPAQQGELLEAE